MRPDRDQLILMRFMICMVLPPEWVKRQNAANWKAPHFFTLSRALGRLREWYKFPNNDVKDIFY
jgi:hypothetical protein